MAAVACVDVTPPAGLVGKDDGGTRPTITRDGPAPISPDTRPSPAPDASLPGPDATTPPIDGPPPTADAPRPVPDAPPSFDGPVDSPPPPADLAVDTPTMMAPDAPPSPLLKGLVAYWKLDESSGTVAEDSSGNGNRGMHVNAPMISSASAPVLFPNPRSLTFDPAANNAVVVPDSPSLSVTGAITVAAWVRRNVTTSPVYEPIVEKWDSSPVAQRGYFLRLGVDGHVVFAVLGGGGTNSNTAPSTPVVPANTWTHVAGVYDIGMMVVYINGVAYGSKSPGNGPGDGTSPLEIGRNSSQSFPGWIDDVRIYDRALSAAEIAELARGTE
jgi:hypothetical protein